MCHDFEIGSIHSSFHPFVCLDVFLELHHWFFLNFGVMLETHMKLCVAVLDLTEKNFCPQTCRIAGFFHQPYFQKKSIKLPNFLQDLTSSQKNNS